MCKQRNKLRRLTTRYRTDTAEYYKERDRSKLNANEVGLGDRCRIRNTRGQVELEFREEDIRSVGERLLAYSEAQKKKNTREEVFILTKANKLK